MKLPRQLRPIHHGPDKNADPLATPEDLGNSTAGWTQHDYEVFYDARENYLTRLATHVESPHGHYEAAGDCGGGP